MSDLGTGDGLPEIGGDMLPGTILDHVRACRIHIAEEQRKPNPDTALIATLCDAVRFAREHVNEKKERAKATPYQHGERRTVAGVRPASINDQSARLNPPAERLADDFPRFACDKCGKLRTKAEGGEVWTTCEGYGRNCDGSSEWPAGEAIRAQCGSPDPRFCSDIPCDPNNVEPCSDDFHAAPPSDVDKVARDQPPEAAPPEVTTDELELEFPRLSALHGGSWGSLLSEERFQEMMMAARADCAAINARLQQESAAGAATVSAVWDALGARSDPMTGETISSRVRRACLEANNLARQAEAHADTTAAYQGAIEQQRQEISDLKAKLARFEQFELKA